MKNLLVAALATLFGLSAASGIAPQFVSTAAVAVADPGGHGHGQGHGRSNQGNGNWQNGQYNNTGTNNTCNSNGGSRGDNDNDNDNDGNGGQRPQLPPQAQQPHGRGHRYGWQNPHNPHYGCNNNNCGGQYGQNNGQCNPGGSNGNSVIRGTITAVNGNQVSLMEGFGQFITINDQPALDSQNTGRVVIGRYVTAYGYYQNGIFYATSLQ